MKTKLSADQYYRKYYDLDETHELHNEEIDYVKCMNGFLREQTAVYDKQIKKLEKEKQELVELNRFACNALIKIKNWDDDDEEYDDVGYLAKAALEKITSNVIIGSYRDKAIKYVISSYVDDSKGLPAMLIGDVDELIKIITGEEIDLWNILEKFRSK